MEAPSSGSTHPLSTVSSLNCTRALSVEPTSFRGSSSSSEAGWRGLELPDGEAVMNDAPRLASDHEWLSSSGRRFVGSDSLGDWGVGGDDGAGEGLRGDVVGCGEAGVDIVG